MENTEKLITVTGQGSVHVVPDVTRIELTLTTLHDTYEEAYQQAKRDTDAIGDIMDEVKLDRKLPKTTRFNIDKKTVSEYDKYKNYTGEKFLGFELDHVVKIDLGMDNVLLNQLVRGIGKRLKQAEISIGYTVKDSRGPKLKMLDRAVKDAKEKAEIMANAAGCKLGMCKSIDYDVNSIVIFSQARNIHGSEEASCCNTESLDITPDDLSVSDSVNVVWYLSNEVKKEKDHE